MRDTLIRIGAAIGNRRMRTCDRGNHSVHWTGLLGRGDIAWTGLLALCVRLQAVVRVEDMHAAISAAFPDLYEPEFVAGQLEIIEGKLRRGEFVPGWHDLLRLVPNLARFEESIHTAMKKANEAIHG